MSDPGCCGSLTDLAMRPKRKETLSALVRFELSLNPPKNIPIVFFPEIRTAMNIFEEELHLTAFIKLKPALETVNEFETERFLSNDTNFRFVRDHMQTLADEQINRSVQNEHGNKLFLFAEASYADKLPKAAHL